MKKTFDVRDEIFLFSFGELRLNCRNETKNVQCSFNRPFQLVHFVFPFQTT